MPSADEYAGYEIVLPGVADRILTMAEKQSGHRQILEKRELEIDAQNSLLGTIFAFAFATVTMCGSFFLIYNGREIAGSVLGSASPASVVTAFRQSRKQEGRKKIPVSKYKKSKSQMPFSIYNRSFFRRILRFSYGLK